MSLPGARSFRSDYDPRQGIRVHEPRKTALIRALELTPAIAAARDLDSLLAAIVDSAVELTGAQGGYILTIDGSGDPRVEVARDAKKSAVAPGDVRLSKTITTSALAASETLLIENASRDPRFAGSISIRDFWLRSVIAAPLRARDERLGVLVVEDRSRDGVFELSHVRLLDLVAAHAALAIDQAQRLERATDLSERLGARATLLEDELARAVHHDDAPLRLRTRFSRFQGSSPRLVGLLIELERCCASDLPVLVTGESGTGKELVARSIHECGAHASGPFVIVNVPALPASVFESELFGHERGAFTGAGEAREGLVASAQGGTLFLDEIGDLPLASQPKLLRFLQEHEYRPLGAERSCQSNTRVLAATNRDLRLLVAAGDFRADLYHRLRVLSVEVPPLRSRAEDVPILARHFLERDSRHQKRKTRRLSVDALERLREHDWPGNVRELENAVLRAVSSAGKPIRGPIQASELALDARPRGRRPVTLAEIERDAIETALRECKSQSAAARRLGIDRSTLWRKTNAGQ